MKISMKLTLDGLIRALKTRAHDIADASEIGHSIRAADPERVSARSMQRSRKGQARGGGDGRTRA